MAASGVKRATRMVAALAVSVALGIAACGDGTDTETDPTTTTTADDGTSSTGESTTAPATSSTTETSPGTTDEVTTTTTSAGDEDLTIADLERALDVRVPIVFPDSAPGTVECDGSGPLADWQPIDCHYFPDEPAEFPWIHISMLDGGRYGWGFGACCAAAPWPEDYEPGLFCRDLVEPPVNDSGHTYPEESDHLTYGLAMYYWLSEGRPDRMDADLNGKPCETVYPAAEVDEYWNSVEVVEPSANE